MFEQHIPEKIIQERSGHRSLEALRVYEKTTNQQKIAASRVMTACLPSTSGTVGKHENLTDYEEKRSKKERSRWKRAVKSTRRNYLIHRRSMAVALAIALFHSKTDQLHMTILSLV